MGIYDQFLFNVWDIYNQDIKKYMLIMEYICYQHMLHL